MPLKIDDLVTLFVSLAKTGSKMMAQIKAKVFSTAEMKDISWELNKMKGRGKESRWWYSIKNTLKGTSVALLGIITTRTPYRLNRELGKNSVSSTKQKRLSSVCSVSKIPPIRRNSCCVLYGKDREKREHERSNGFQCFRYANARRLLRLKVLKNRHVIPSAV